ncbi:uncharacterized protein SPSK_04268 [Sporothrix schenckii 1099-18]|uniref:BZIP transcription factor n=1 Tax=Sporothrix schenckii 1099-18 TaxID=1397361 RepID=A0A0F2M1I8_SPOSC|nr:uncharacterized protein SPSK_04268 [Sporothrix schenckii 1099-18]KJR82944.1 hypothetical protein SPSK_04268 [Sporothrix schenckii 1099-18]
MTLPATDGDPGLMNPSPVAATAPPQSQAPAEPPKHKRGIGRRVPPPEGSRPLDKKRARDRRAQQALRDRTRSTIHNLSEQVSTLTRVLERQSQELSVVRGRLDAVTAENAMLRQRAAEASEPVDGASAATSPSCPLWKTPPLNSPPASIADQLFQGFVDVQRRAVALASPSATSASTSSAPDITPLLDSRRRGTDEVSRLASDVVRTYSELDTLPKQIAVHFLMTHLLKWFVLLDEPSWNSVPVWLRPTRAQRTIEHPPWIDRIPWPAARDYLVVHPEITLDHFAASYGTSVQIRWPYDPSMVVIVTPSAPGSSNNFIRDGDGDGDVNDYIVNPVFAHHIAKLANWEVGDAFRARFPEMARLIDESLLLNEDGQTQTLIGEQPASQTVSPSTTMSTTTSPSSPARPVQPLSMPMAMPMESGLDYLPV